MTRLVWVIALLLTAGCDQHPTRHELETKIARLESENSRLREESAGHEVASERYDACLMAAQSAYDDRWNGSCAKLRKKDIQQKESCNKSSMGEEYCASIEVGEASNCSLPADIANQYDAELKNEKKLCMERLKLGR